MNLFAFDPNKRLSARETLELWLPAAMELAADKKAFLDYAKKTADTEIILSGIKDNGSARPLAAVLANMMANATDNAALESMLLQSTHPRFSFSQLLCQATESNLGDSMNEGLLDRDEAEEIMTGVRGNILERGAEVRGNAAPKLALA